MRRLPLGFALLVVACHRDRGSPGISADPTPHASASTKPLAPPTAITEKLESHEGEVEVSMSWPRIDLGGGSAGATISAKIEKELKSEAERIRRSYHDAVVADADAGSPFLHDWQLDVDCAPTLVAHRLVSVACEGYDFEGGAHGMPTAFGYTHEIVDDQPEEVTLQDIVGAGGIARLAPPCLDSLKRQGSTYANDGTLDAATIVKDGYLATYVLERRGLTFVFPPYSAGPYVEGEYYVTLDWKTLRTVASDPKVIARLQAEAEEPGAIDTPFGEERDNSDAGP
jgi:hypothetical protein